MGEINEKFFSALCAFGMALSLTACVLPAGSANDDEGFYGYAGYDLDFERELKREHERERRMKRRMPREKSRRTVPPPPAE